MQCHPAQSDGIADFTVGEERGLASDGRAVELKLISRSPSTRGAFRLSQGGQCPVNPSRLSSVSSSVPRGFTPCGVEKHVELLTHIEPGGRGIDCVDYLENPCVYPLDVVAG